MRNITFRFSVFLFFFLIPCVILADAKLSTAPNFTAKDLDGKKVELKEVLKSGPVLLSFWATWCKPCIKELSEVQKVYKTYKEKGFEVLAVDVDGPRSVSKVKSTVKGLGWDFPVLWDESKDIYRSYQVLGIPHTVLINTSGEIVYTHTTYRPGDEEIIKKKIEGLLNKPVQPAEKQGEKSEK